MTIHRKAAFLLAAGALLLLPGCLSAHLPLSPGSEGRHLEIVRIDAPATTPAGAPVTLTLTARLYGSGWRVGQAVARLDPLARTLTLAGTALPVAGPGPFDAAVREETTTVTFTPLAGGTYRFEVPYGSERAKLARTIRVLD